MAEFNSSENRYILRVDEKYYNTLDIEGFSQMMKDTSYCYKFYWLEAIVQLISEGVKETTFEGRMEYLNYLRPAIGTIFIPYGQGRNFIERGIHRKNSIIFCRRICDQFMIQRDGKGMRFGM